jgi:hypothetical protein
MYNGMRFLFQLALFGQIGFPQAEESPFTP